MHSEKKTRKANEAYKFVFCQYCRCILYLGYWYLGMGNIPSEYKKHVFDKYGIEAEDSGIKEIDLTKKSLPLRKTEWKKFTLAEFNGENRARAETVPAGIFSRLTPQAWKRLYSLLKPVDELYSKMRGEVLGANIGLVKLMLNKAVRNRNTDGVMSMEDAQSEAYIAACRAFDHFLMGRGKISIYMAFKIEQAVKEKLDNNISAIKTPGYIQRTLRKILSVMDEFEEKHGRVPTPSELAEMTNHPKGRIESLLNTDLNNIVSLDAPVGGDDEELSLHELIAAPEETQQWECGRELMRELFREMTPRERRIISYRFELKRPEKIASEGILEKIGKGKDIARGMCKLGRERATYQFRKLSGYA